MMTRWKIGGVCLLVLGAFAGPSRAQTGETILLKSNFEAPRSTWNPWGGVDSAGNISVPVGYQFAVDEDGSVRSEAFSPGLAAGDLRGTGLNDLVVADSRGYFWFFPNSGTKTVPHFTYGEVMPIWAGTESVRNTAQSSVVPRIQLVDVDGDGKLDLLIGTFDGRLYCFHNKGTPQMPVFTMPEDISSLEIPTSSRLGLWCNYLSPFLFSWTENGPKALIMGDGSYSANSIYLLKNVGSATRPSFREDQRYKIIPGMGREHLTPQVVDWNGDGKPDILCGERAGYIDLFLNNSTDPDGIPTFAPGVHLTLGQETNFGHFVLPCVASLTGAKLPSLIMSNSLGQLLYAENKGTPTQPSFPTDPVTLKGAAPYPPILVNDSWKLGTPFGDSYCLLEVVNSTVEPGFKPPDGHQGKNALKAFVFTPKTTYFNTRYKVGTENETDNEFGPNQHSVTYISPVTLQESKRYQASFMVYTDGDIQDTQLKLFGVEFKKDSNDHNDFELLKPFSTSGSWTQVTEDLEWRTAYDNKGMSLPFTLSIRWKGQGAIYLDDIVLKTQ